MAVRDGLTGVYNRSYLELALGRTSKEVRRNGGTASVLFLDVDGMKEANDTYGHQAGDTLLCDLAALLEESCRETDIVARIGGDEFVVLMPGADEEGAGRVAGKIEAMIAGHNNAVEGPLRLSVSMGLHSADGRDIDRLLQEADRRMYATNACGRATPARPRGRGLIPRRGPSVGLARSGRREARMGRPRRRTLGAEVSALASSSAGAVVGRAAGAQRGRPRLPR